MAIPTRKSLWDQIKDLLSPPSQAVNQSQIQSTAQQNQNQIKNYTDLYYTNPYTQQSISTPAPTGDVNNSGSSYVSYGISNPFETVKKENQSIFQPRLNQDTSNQSIIPSQPDYSNSFVESIKPDYSNSFLDNFNQQTKNQPLDIFVNQSPNLFTPFYKGYDVINKMTTGLGNQFRQETLSEKWQDIGNFIKDNVQQAAQSVIKLAYSLGPGVQNIIQTREPSSLDIPKTLQPILGTDKITSYQQDVQNNFNLIRQQNPDEPYALSVIKAAAYPVIDLLVNAYFTERSLAQGAKFLTSLGPDEEQVSAWATLGRPETVDEAKANYFDLIQQYKQQQILGGPQAEAINNAYNIIKTKGIPDVHTITGVVSKIGQALLSSPSEAGKILTSPITGVPKVAQTRLLPSRVGYTPEQPFQPLETPPLVPVGLSTQPIPTSPEQPNLPDEIADLVGKTEPNGATIKQIVPALNGYEATIVSPTGKEFKTIINGANLDTFIQTYNPSPAVKIDGIKSQLIDLHHQLDATEDPVEQAVIQSKIDRLQKQIDELTSNQTTPQTTQEVQPQAPKITEKVQPETQQVIQEVQQEAPQITQEITSETQPKTQPQATPITKSEIEDFKKNVLERTDSGYVWGKKLGKLLKSHHAPEGYYTVDGYIFKYEPGLGRAYLRDRPPKNMQFNAMNLNTGVTEKLTFDRYGILQSKEPVTQESQPSIQPQITQETKPETTPSKSKISKSSNPFNFSKEVIEARERNPYVYVLSPWNLDKNIPPKNSIVLYDNLIIPQIEEITKYIPGNTVKNHIYNYIIHYYNKGIKEGFLDTMSVLSDGINKKFAFKIDDNDIKLKLVPEDTTLSQLKEMWGEPKETSVSKPEEIIKTLENKPSGLNEQYVQIKNKVDDILNDKSSRDNIPKVKEEINKLQGIISNRVDNELSLLDKLPDDLRKQYTDQVVKEIASLKEKEARLNDMVTNLNDYLNPEAKKNNTEVKVKLPAHYTLENVDFSNSSNLERGQLYKVTLRNGKVRYGIYNGEGVAMDGTSTYEFKTNRGHFEISQRGSLVLSKPQKIERVISLSTKTQRVKPEVQPEAKPTETQPETQLQINQEVQPEIKPAETPISQSETPPETPLNAQNSPLEPSNTQESINIPPTENTLSQTQNLEGENISQHSQKLGELIGEPGQPYTPISEKEELNKVKNWLETNPNAIKDIEMNNIPSNLNIGSLFTVAYQSGDPELISAVLNNINLSQRITEAAQTITTLDYGKKSVVNTAKIYTGVKAKKTENVKNLYGLKDNNEVYDKIKGLSNGLSDEIRNTIQKVAEQSVPKLGEILDKEGVNLDSLISMPSDERIKLLAKYYGADAFKINQSFENAVLSKKSIENGVIQTIEQWAKRQKLPTPTQEIVDTAKKLLNDSKIDKAFSPELSSVVNQVVNKAVGMYLSPEEAGQLQTYINQASQDLQNFDYEKGEWTTPEAGTKFGTDYYKLQNYIRDLSEANNPSELARQIMTELKIAREKGFVNLIGKAAELTFKDLNDLSTAMVASGDISIVGRQMRKLLFTHPGIWFKVFEANLQALKTDPEKYLESVYIKLYSDPNFVAGRMNNLIPRTFEELPAVKFLEWTAKQKAGLPLQAITRTAVAFEGGYIRGLQLYADYVYNAEKLRGLNIDDKKVIKDVQDYVKTFLGQSPLGNSKFWQAYSYPAWAAGLTKSNLLTGYTYLFGGAPESVRGLAAKESWMVRIGSFALMLLFTFLYGKKRIQWDPRAANYSGVQLSPTKDDYIILNPYNAEDVLLARMLLHIYNKMNPDNAVPNFVSSVTGKAYDTTNAGFGEPNMWDVIVDFAEGKSKPMVGLFIDFLKNEAFGGKQLTAGEAAKRVSVPITGQNTWDVIMNTEAGRKAYGIITDLANALGVNTTHMIRSTPWDYNFTKEVYRLAENYPDMATAYHLGFLQANKALTPKENQEIFDYIVKTVNEEGVPFIQSQTYQQLSDDMKAKAIAKSLDGIREEAYERLMYNRIVNAPPQQLDKVLLHFYRAGLFNSTRLKDMWSSFTPDMRDKILDIVNNKILPLEKKS